jgi:hypothetical protein
LTAYSAFFGDPRWIELAALLQALAPMPVPLCVRIVDAIVVVVLRGLRRGLGRRLTTCEKL